MTKSKILLYFCLFFIAGIFLDSIIFMPQLSMLSILILGILLISVLWQYKKLAIAGFCLIFLVAGTWRHQTVLSGIKNSKIKNFIGKEIALVGLIDKQPSQREKTTRLEIEIEKIPAENTSRQAGGHIEGIPSGSYRGRVLVTSWRYPEYGYGDRLEIAGKLEEPPEIEGFNYEDYLAKDGILAVMYFPKVDLLERNQGNFLKRSLIFFKNKLEESLNRVVPRPESAILEALFFGKEENISSGWKEKLNLTGTRHITAVSGMNLTILSVLLLNILLSMGLWRQQALYLSIVLIIFYILMIGAPSSVVRAGIMAVLFLTAQYFGRYSSGSRAIVFAATLMLFQNPLLLKLDVGFQLSFLATMGLIYLQPILIDWFKKFPNKFQLKNNLSATFAAQIFTLPILIYNFGHIPVLSPVINVFILPLIPFVTIWGFLFSFIGISWQTLAQILSWPAWLSLTYILRIIDFSSNISWVSLSLENVHWIFVIISYLVLGFFLFWFHQKRKLKFLSY